MLKSPLGSFSPAQSSCWLLVFHHSVGVKHVFTCLCSTEWSKNTSSNWLCYSVVTQKNLPLSFTASSFSISTHNPHAAVFQTCNPGILLVQHPGEAGSTLSCFSPCFGASLCRSSACHSCFGSLFLLAVCAKYKRIAAVDLVSLLRRAQPHRPNYYQSRTAPVGPDTSQTLLPVMLGAVWD